MKKGWKYKTIKECCDILDYRRKPITKSKRESGSIPYYGATGLLDFVKDYIFDETLVLLGEDGAKWGAGESSAYQISGKTWVNNHAHVLRPLSNIVCNYWLIYFLNYSDLRSYITGVTVPKLNQEKMSSIIIPLPPISEQKEIVEYLDSSFAKIDKLKENAAKNLEEAKALFQSALKDALEPKEGWEEKTMDEVCILSQGLAINSKTKHLLVEKSSIPLLRIKDMKDGTREIFVDDKNYPPKCLAHPEELIYTRTGTLGLIFTGMFGIVHNNCFKIKLDEKILNKYYYMYFVGSDNFRNMILSIASRAAQPDITHKLFKVQKIQFPTLSEQQSIVSHLDSLNEKVNTLQQNYSRVCDECDALKQAILRQVFE